MKQNVSTPVAAIVLALVVLVSIIVFSRPDLTAPGPEPFVLPYSPPIEEREILMLRQGLTPLGLVCVMPPLATDRFKGARVALVVPNTPAEKGGVRPGDLITKFNDLKVSSPYSIVGALRRVDPAKPNTVVVVRAGKEQQLIITGLTPPPQKGAA